MLIFPTFCVKCSSRTILEKYLKPAVSLAADRKCTDKKSIERQGQTHFHLAHYADALFRSCEERLTSNEWQAAMRLRKHKVTLWAWTLGANWWLLWPFYLHVHSTDPGIRSTCKETEEFNEGKSKYSINQWPYFGSLTQLFLHIRYWYSYICFKSSDGQSFISYLGGEDRLLGENTRVAKAACDG